MCLEEARLAFEKVNATFKTKFSGTIQLVKGLLRPAAVSLRLGKWTINHTAATT